MIQQYLARYAITSSRSLGRIEKEEHFSKNPINEFLHDSDRIIKSKAFQKLNGKTQVVNAYKHENNTNRQTHSMEVAQIAASIAYHLGLNTSAVKAIALGHDLGHTPFGHCGERVLNEILDDYDMPGFKHNYQSLLTVNKLEEGYHRISGLNLMHETRDGILKHTSLGKINNLNYYDSNINKSPEHPITLEGQIVSIGDEIAQRTHDTRDGLQTNRIDINDLIKEKIVKNSFRHSDIDGDDILQEFHKNRDMVIYRVINALLEYYKYQTLTNANNNIKKFEIKTYNDVVNQSIPVISWDKYFLKQDEDFKKNILEKSFYQHNDIQHVDSRAIYFIKKLFTAFKKNPRKLSDSMFNKFLGAVRSDLVEEYCLAAGTYKKDLANFLGNGIKKCTEGCSYIPNSQKNTNRLTTCPLNLHCKPACKGIRVIINYIAGLTDRSAYLEYARCYN